MAKAQDVEDAASTHRCCQWRQAGSPSPGSSTPSGWPLTASRVTQQSQSHRLLLPRACPGLWMLPWGNQGRSPGAGLPQGPANPKREAPGKPDQPASLRLLQLACARAGSPSRGSPALGISKRLCFSVTALQRRFWFGHMDSKQTSTWSQKSSGSASALRGWL